MDYTPSTHTVTFSIGSGHAAGEKLVVVGDRFEMGEWNVAAGVEMTPTAEPGLFSATVNVGTAGMLQYKFVIINAVGEPYWEVGNNRLRNITQDEDLDCGVFHTHTFEASNQQQVDAFLDHKRYFETFASPTDVMRLEDELAELRDTSAALKDQNAQLLFELAEAQTQLASAKAAATAAATPDTARVDENTSASSKKASVTRRAAKAAKSRVILGSRASGGGAGVGAPGFTSVAL